MEGVSCNAAEGALYAMPRIRLPRKAAEVCCRLARVAAVHHARLTRAGQTLSCIQCAWPPCAQGCSGWPPKCAAACRVVQLRTTRVSCGRPSDLALQHKHRATICCGAVMALTCQRCLCWPR